MAAEQRLVGRQRHADNRPGAALVAVLALLALGSALVIGTFGTARAATAAAAAARADARVDAAARQGLARLVLEWDDSLDSLPIGTQVSRAGMPSDSARPRVRVTVSVRRLEGSLYLIVASAQLGFDGASFARRRYRLLVEKPSAGDDGAARPRQIVSWSLDETN